MKKLISFKRTLILLLPSLTTILLFTCFLYEKQFDELTPFHKVMQVGFLVVVAILTIVALFIRNKNYKAAIHISEYAFATGFVYIVILMIGELPYEKQFKQLVALTIAVAYLTVLMGLENTIDLLKTLKLKSNK